MKQVDMKMKRSSKPANMPAVVGSAEKDEYPYGLRLSLNNEEIKKLGINGNVGDEVAIMATGSITGKRENEQQGGKEEKNIEIQIKKLCIHSAMKEAGMEAYAEERKKK